MVFVRCAALLVLISLNAQAQQNSQPTQVQGSTQSVQEALKSLVSNAQLKLGDLQPWQKRIFVEEAVPQYQRFVRDYRVSGSNVQAEIDIEILKKFLAFHINPNDNKKQETRVGLYVRADADCEKCTAAQSKLRAIAQSRLERRGFIPNFIQSDDLGDRSTSAMSGKTLEERASAVAARKGWIGAMVIQASIAPGDALDTAHADEKEYLVRSALLIPTLQIRQDGQLRVLESESLETATTRVLTDSFTDLGTRTLSSASLKRAEESGEELALVVSGIRDFHQFSQLKLMIQTKLNDQASVEERKLMRGRAVFAIRTEKSVPEIRGELTRLTIDQARWSLLPEGGSGVNTIDSGVPVEKTIEAEIQ